jgi:hypothetical protein
MAQREPTAAQALYGHLPSAAREPVKQREQSLVDALEQSGEATRSRPGALGCLL